MRTEDLENLKLTGHNDENKSNRTNESKVTSCNKNCDYAFLEMASHIKEDEYKNDASVLARV